MIYADTSVARNEGFLFDFRFFGQVSMSRIIAPQSVTVVLPVYNEIDNVGSLLSELYLADSSRFVKRVIYVDDDSPDGTSEHIKNTRFPLEVLCLHRIGRQGLGSAVVEGMLLADTEYVAVMDADGQHSPVDLVRMIQMLQETGANILIGSRFKDKVSQESHTGFRNGLSRFGNRISRFLLNQTLTDPLTGFFLMERKLFLEVARIIRPSGFKILLEILYSLRSRNLLIREMQISFRPRNAGESKLDSAVVLDFVGQILSRMSNGVIPEKFPGFAIIGGSGVVIHFAVLYCLLFVYGQTFLASQGMAILMAIVWNYTLNNMLTFRRNRRLGAKWFRGLALFMVVCSAGALANLGVAGMLNSSGLVWWISGLAGILAGVGWNYSMSRFLVWKT